MIMCATTTITPILPLLQGPEAHISVQYFTPQQSHSSLAVSGGCCLASACLIPGTIPHRIASTRLAPITGSHEGVKSASTKA